MLSFYLRAFERTNPKKGLNGCNSEITMSFYPPKFMEKSSDPSWTSFLFKVQQLSNFEAGMYCSKKTT